MSRDYDFRLRAPIQISTPVGKSSWSTNRVMIDKAHSSSVADEENAVRGVIAQFRTKQTWRALPCRGCAVSRPLMRTADAERDRVEQCLLGCAVVEQAQGVARDRPVMPRSLERCLECPVPPHQRERVLEVA